MRRALLLGLDVYHQERLTLTAAAKDVAQLAEVLSRVGYAREDIVSHVSSQQQAQLTVRPLRRAIREFLKSAQAEDDLLVYISGHGIELDGHRLVVPIDYDPEDVPPVSELIGDQQMYALARDECIGRSVVYIVDACREGAQLQLAPQGASTKSAVVSKVAAEQSAAVPSVAILFSCASREVSSVDERQDLSYFTAALCEVLEHAGVAGLREIAAGVQSLLRARLEADNRPLQTVSIDERPIEGRGGDPNLLLVKEDLAARSRLSIEQSPWCRALHELALWQRLIDFEALRDQVSMVVMRAERHVNEMARQCSRQRWLNVNAPLSVLRRLALMLGPTGVVRLGPADAAVALAVPFVYEAVLAEGHLLLAAGNLQEDFGERLQVGRAARALRAELLADSAHERRRKFLRSKDDDEAADDLLYWQFLRFLHASGELWELSSWQQLSNIASRPAQGVGWIGQALVDLLAPAPFDSVTSDSRVMRLMDPRRLLKLARMSIANFEDIEVERRRGRLERVLAGEGTASLCIDEGTVAHLMALAMMACVDARRLSPLLAEHIGVTSEIRASRLNETLRDAEWATDGDGWSLSLLCPHEAIDAALEELATQMHLHLSRLPQELNMPPLPRRVDAVRLRAALGPDGRELYRKPHLRLTLDEARIRELLMGTELYGERTLALRELYQNAMDACRYRRARVSFLRKRDPTIADYRGAITFAVGFEGARPYIECRDNGIGMSERHLQRLFARAGQRFTDSHEFHLEKAAWEEAKIAFHANSRFGVGVYSYFMLADEVRVTTRRLGEDGVSTEDGLTAEVLADGQLFRVRSTSHAHVGSTVRLFLATDANPDELLKHFSKWLWLPEFDLWLESSDGNAVTYPAREIILWSARGTRIPTCTPIPGAVDEWGNPCLFWRQPEERVRNRPPSVTTMLCDGIATLTQQRPKTSALSQLPYLLVNMTGELRPQLSVDRLRITEWHAAREWAFHTVHEHGWRSLLAMPGLRLDTLQDIIATYPAVASRADDALRNGMLSASVETAFAKGSSLPLPLGGIGLSELDELVLALLAQSNDDEEALTGANARRHETCLRLAFSKEFQPWIAGRIAQLCANGLVLPRNFDLLATWKSNPVPPFGSAILMIHMEEAPQFDQALSAHQLMREAFRQARRTHLPVSKFIEWLQPAREFFEHLPEVPSRLSTLIPDDTHLELLDIAIPAAIDGSVAFICPTTGELLLAAMRCDVSLAEMVETARALSPLLTDAPNVSHELLAHDPTDDLRDILDDIESDEPFAIDGNISLLAMLLAANNRELTLEQVWAIFEQLELYGFRRPELPAALTDKIPPELVVELHSRDLDALPPFTRNVPLTRAAIYCSRNDMSFDELQDALGVWLALDSFEELVKSPYIAASPRLLRGVTEGWHIPYKDWVTTARSMVVSCAIEECTSIRATLLTAGDLSSIGLKDGDFGGALLDVFPTDADLEVLSHGSVSWQTMATLMKENQRNAAEILRRWREWGLPGDWEIEGALVLLAALRGRGETGLKSVTPIQLAFAAERAQVLVGEFTDALRLLCKHGWDATGALAFAEGIQSRSTSTHAGPRQTPAARADQLHSLPEMPDDWQARS